MGVSSGIQAFINRYYFTCTGREGKLFITSRIVETIVKRKYIVLFRLYIYGICASKMHNYLLFYYQNDKKKKRQIRINCVKAVVNGCTDCIMKYKH